MRASSAFVALGLMTIALAGCVADEPSSSELKKIAGNAPGVGPTAAPFLDYKPQPPDMNLELMELDYFFDAANVLIHGRVVRPVGEGPFPVIVQFTPYTAPGRNAVLSTLIEPVVPTNPIGIPGDSFVNQFVRRGYAFVYADVRGTGDSSGCLDLRGEKDILDAGKLTDFFGTQPWSNGKVGFIGASYPGSEAHMAGIANSPYLGAVVPVVASTSFYHYHHNDGVPYNGNHALGGTNAGYTQNAISPTLNPQSENYVPRYMEEVMCPYKENIVDHGGLDQTGAYYAWWQERNLRPRAKEVRVPVLMAQGLADWNVKPDHIAEYFNNLETPSKTLIAGQWGHQYPKDAPEAYGLWWEYVTAFFDTHLKGIETGMFTTNTAWIQDSGGAWHRSANFPLVPEERNDWILHLTKDKTLASQRPSEPAELSWYGCPNDEFNRGTAASTVEDLTIACNNRPDQALTFTTAPFPVDTLVSGVPLVKLTLRSDAPTTHLVLVVNKIAADGSVAFARENYGYLNPTYRDGLDKPAPLPDGAYTVTIDLYPQEDLIKAGEALQFIVRSDDAGRTIEFFEEGANTLLLGPDSVNEAVLPVRPAQMQGVRLG
jgi:putative CocE/NonD family hydrolase